jgi:hypothetical protein
MMVHPRCDRMQKNSRSLFLKQSVEQEIRDRVAVARSWAPREESFAHCHRSCAKAVPLELKKSGPHREVAVRDVRRVALCSLQPPPRSGGYQVVVLERRQEIGTGPSQNERGRCLKLGQRKGQAPAVMPRHESHAHARLLPMCPQETAACAMRERTRIALAAPLLHRHQEAQE